MNSIQFKLRLVVTLVAIRNFSYKWKLTLLCSASINNTRGACTVSVGWRGERGVVVVAAVAGEFALASVVKVVSGSFSCAFIS